MKKIVLLLSCMLFSGLIMANEMDIKQTMKAMKTAFVFSVRATDVSKLNRSLTELEALVQHAQQLSFPKEKEALYLEGLNKVSVLVTQAKQQAEEGKMAQAQATLKDVDLLREEYHEQRNESIWKRLFPQWF